MTLNINFQASVKVRRHHDGENALVYRNSDLEWTVSFKHPAAAISPGQSAVFYDSDRLIGGGVIDKIY